MIIVIVMRMKIIVDLKYGSGTNDYARYKQYSNVGRLFCTPAPPKFTKKLAVDSFFNFGS